MKLAADNLINQPLDGRQLAILAAGAIVGLLLLYVAIKITSVLIRFAMAVAVAAVVIGLVWWAFGSH